jgi:hypothetical protein
MIGNDGSPFDARRGRRGGGLEDIAQAIRRERRAASHENELRAKTRSDAR